ncbi:MAG: DUF975 family protein [Oscillospiraceae bacterium]|jgi:uncharacterized membrane protein|nr:DUF975 family protein [Oscillospiraceae bacterium]
MVHTDAITINDAKAAKLRAKKVLQGHWGAACGILFAGLVTAIGAGLLPLLTDLAVRQTALIFPDTGDPIAAISKEWMRTVLSAVAVLFACLICAPLRMGREAWYFGGADGKKRTSMRVLFWLIPRNALKATRFLFAVGIRKFLWAVLYLLPGTFLLIGTITQSQSAALDAALFFAAIGCGAVLLAVGFGFYLATVQRYALVPAILAKQPAAKCKNALRLSAARMEGNCAKMLRFRAGFIPWFLLCFFVVPAGYVLPYYTQSCACRHKNLLLDIRV